MLRTLVNKRRAKAKEIQELCGFLNFLCKAIFPGRPFLRCMYSKYSKVMALPGRHSQALHTTEVSDSGFKLKKYHHVKIDAEFKSDCLVWLEFLNEAGVLAEIVNRPMIDTLALYSMSTDICFYSDACAAHNLGYGCILNNNWLGGDWGSQFIKDCKPSIEYLELFALCAGVFTWEKHP